MSWQKALVFIFSLLLTACLQESTRGDRKAIGLPTATPTETPTGCTSQCEVRPDGDIKIAHTFCACQAGVPVMVGNCASFCALTNDPNPTLYLTFEPGVKTTSHVVTLKSLGGGKGPLTTTKNWCSVEIDDGNTTGTNCLLEASNGSTVKTFPPVNVSDNKITFNISTMDEGVPWVFTLREQTSGASTSTAQLYRAKSSTYTPIGPLKVRPVSEYACFTRIGVPGSTSATNTYENIARLHFYYPSGKTLDPLPATANGYNVCHDFQNLGLVDSSSYLRNELQDHIFAVWDPSDTRFSTSSTTLPINTEIKNRLLKEYGITADIKIFSVMTWPDTLVLSDGSNTQTKTPDLGVIMQAWIDAETQLAFCPNSINYNTTTAVFRVLKDYVSDTEGLFLAQRESKSYLDSTGTIKIFPNDFQLIREGLLKKIWFYLENGTPTIPNAITAQTKTIQFYWPPSLVNPLIRQSNQEVFTIKHPTEVSSLSGSPSSGTIPSDKRFACIPVKGKEGE